MYLLGKLPEWKFVIKKGQKQFVMGTLLLEYALILVQSGPCLLCI